MTTEPGGAYGILRSGPFPAYLASRTFAIVGSQMTATAVGWQVAERTRSPLALGLVGLAQVLPVLFLAPWAGHLADRADRRRVMMFTQTLHAACVGALALTVLFPGIPLSVLYAILFVDGISRGIQSPSAQAILPNLVPPALLARAVSWRLVSFELSSIGGPLAAGFLIGRVGMAPVYAIAAGLLVLGAAVLWRLPRQVPRADGPPAAGGRDLLAGFRYVWGRPVLRGALALDLFAVLFGGVTALLPIFARDVLEAGPEGLGMLRGANSVGSLVMTFILLHRPPLERAGTSLLLAVAGYGACMAGFGLSTSFWLSLSFLVASGLFDAVSVVIRHTMIQADTPDRMRGQVSAVNGVFIVSSNQLGEFESGVAAQLLGVAPSVVVGGVLTLAVVAVAAWKVPEIRRLRRLDAITV